MERKIKMHYYLIIIIEFSRKKITKKLYENDFLFLSKYAFIKPFTSLLDAKKEQQEIAKFMPERKKIDTLIISDEQFKTSRTIYS